MLSQTIVPDEKPCTSTSTVDTSCRPRKYRLVKLVLAMVLVILVSDKVQQSSILQKFINFDVTFPIKRDDMTGGVELGGNKVQKLKFLLVDALERGCNSVVIIGGKQSNHCRTTACAARAL